MVLESENDAARVEFMENARRRLLDLFGLAMAAFDEWFVTHPITDEERAEVQRDYDAENDANGWRDPDGPDIAQFKMIRFFGSDRFLQEFDGAIYDALMELEAEEVNYPNILFFPYGPPGLSCYFFGLFMGIITSPGSPYAHVYNAIHGRMPDDSDDDED